MKRIMWLALIGITLTAIGIPSALAQVNLATGDAGQTQWQSGIYSPDATGNQDKAREFDGRNFTLWGIEQLDSYGYSGPWQYWFGARDLVVGDENVVFDLGFLNDLEIAVSTDALTHRLATAPYDKITVGSFHGGVNPYLAGIIYTPPSPGTPSALSGINPTTGVPFGDAYRDLTPDTKFVLDRRVNTLAIRHFLGSEGRVALRGNWWTETEHGPQQVLFYDSPGTKVKSAGTMEIDRSTMNGTTGVDLQVGKQSVINYSLSRTDFSDSSKPVPSGNTVLDSIHVPNVSTTSNTVKARSRLTNRLFFTGVHTNRDRRNKSALAYPGFGAPLDDRIKTSSTNMALTFLATDNLTFTGRYRTYDLDNLVPAVFDTGATSPRNAALSRSTSSLELGGSYTGIKNAFLRLGFERKSTDREEGHGGELPEELIAPSTMSNIWRLSGRYYPTISLSLAGSMEKWNTDHPAFVSTPTDSTRTNLNANYVIRDNFTVYGDFSRWHDKNGRIRVADVPGIHNPVTHLNDPAGAESAVGQGYVNTFTNMNVGVWYGLGSKLTLDADIASIKTESSSWWIIGADTNAPHLQPEFVPYTTQDNQWSVGLTYALKPTCQVYGRFLNSSFDGRSMFTALPGGVVLPDGWTPISGNEKVWTLGFGYNFGEKQRVLLDYSISDWDDKINPGQSGSFNVWRLAWGTTY